MMFDRLRCRLTGHRYDYIGTDPRYGRREWCRRCGGLRTTRGGTLVPTILPHEVEEARRRVARRLFPPVVIIDDPPRPPQTPAESRRLAAIYRAWMAELRADAERRVRGPSR